MTSTRPDPVFRVQSRHVDTMAVREGPGRTDGKGHTVTESQIDTGSEILLGPVDLVVIEFAEANFTGEGLPILLDLVAKGVVRVIDAAVVKANEDGSFVSMAVADLGQVSEEWQLISGWSSGILSTEDVDAVGAILKPGAAAAVIMYENTWAAPFAAAMRAAGGELVAFERIPAADVIAALEAADDTEIES